ncbi:MAG: 50S ribosomal protein L13 [Bacteroidia bacterium]|nr:50S ribosomal protein L13 [Bacteroidia bacterium]
MNTLSYKTVSLNKETISKEWYLIDAENEVLGRLCSRVALILRGKHKPSYTPHVDCGDNVIVINADKVRMTGKKFNEYIYLSHTGYPGGQKAKTPKQMLANNPRSLVEHAIKGMLPKNRLGSQLFRNIYVYAGSEHPHQAQQPKEINLNSIR